MNQSLVVIVSAVVGGIVGAGVVAALSDGPTQTNFRASRTSPRSDVAS